jgi:hypothetical protein
MARVSVVLAKLHWREAINLQQIINVVMFLAAAKAASQIISASSVLIPRILVNAAIPYE